MFSALLFLVFFIHIEGTVGVFTYCNVSYVRFIELLKINMHILLHSIIFYSFLPELLLSKSVADGFNFRKVLQFKVGKF